MRDRSCGRPRRAARRIVVPVVAACGAAAGAPTASAQVPLPLDPAVVLLSEGAPPPPPAPVPVDAAAGASGPAGCPAAGARPAALSRAAARSAMTCLVNVERRRAGLAALDPDRRIGAAASSHAADMVRHRYFAHQRRGGPSLVRRLRRAGWHGRAAAEAIAYGCGTRASPESILRLWLDSPPHRAILLGGRWRHGGIGMRRGAPGARCPGGAVWVLDVGGR